MRDFWLANGLESGALFFHICMEPFPKSWGPIRGRHWGSLGVPTIQARNSKVFIRWASHELARVLEPVRRLVPDKLGKCLVSPCDIVVSCQSFNITSARKDSKTDGCKVWGE